ncbi:MAG: heavy-metal-associated domain-containing protein [candidate division NC10 bacterium]|nr:heavy-metal-associated domain-containing protein [candidate division NC10 bacterium]MBI2562538.1 heavy-metal-associated domain-containing protein [candidate division NC10 bacterium]
MVKRALEGLKGVRSAEVSFDRGEAIVTYEMGIVTIAQMSQAVAQYGFRATLKTPNPR